MILAYREKRFAKRAIQHLLNSHSAVSAEQPGLSGRALYRDILLHTQQVDPPLVDQILTQAEASIDEWTSDTGDRLGFRAVVHFFVMSRYQAAGHAGTVVSLREIVNSLIPADL